MSQLTSRPGRSAAALAALWLLAPAAAGVAQAPAPLRPVEDAARRYREVRAMCADFEQVIEVRLLRRTVESAGRICQKRPNLFSMRFTDPQGDMVISDGEYFWVYYPSLEEEQVMRYAVADSPGRHDFFREFLENPGTKYTAEDSGTERVGDRDCRVVTLTPRVDAAYRRARLWLDTETHLIRRLELHQENETVRTVTLRNVDLAPSLDPGVFTFQAPAGARVIGR